MLINQDSFIVSKKEEFYLVLGAVAADDIVIELDMPLFIEGDLKTKGSIMSNTEIHCSGHILAESITGRGSIKCSSIKAEYLESPSIECVEQAHIGLMLCSKSVFLGDVTIKSLVGTEFSSLGKVFVTDVVCDKFNIIDDLFVTGFFEVKNLSYKTEPHIFEKTTISSRYFTTCIVNTETHKGKSFSMKSD